MTNVDQFESMFRSASREVFRLEAIDIQSVLVVTDREESQAQSFGRQVRGFLTVLGSEAELQWRDVAGSEFRTAGELLALVQSTAPDLICTYRNLHSTAWRWPYSLGTHLDLLTQHLDVPVMVLPHPQAERSADHAMKDTDTVMAITDHLTGDRRLVNYGLRFAADNATLWLTHVEDEATFKRYVDAVSKIPSIDTDEARDRLREQLLKEPLDYIAGCIEVLRTEKCAIRIQHEVTFGRHLSEYKRLIQEHSVDLLIMNTKDDDQLAMHGMAYALAVELREIPLLML
ncbi:MAG: hypothetical protein IID37_16380 [Planctomycetes bacterium]|nr:hypothetical protein [Planctomycetota bacterium]